MWRRREKGDGVECHFAAPGSASRDGSEAEQFGQERER